MFPYNYTAHLNWIKIWGHVNTFEVSPQKAGGTCITARPCSIVTIIITIISRFILLFLQLWEPILTNYRMSSDNSREKHWAAAYEVQWSAKILWPFLVLKA